MNVLILSDSHGMTTELAEIKQRHNVSAMIHCGDSELDMDAGVLSRFIKVGGNCDSDARFPNEQTIDINGLTFYITHGHLAEVNSNLLKLSYRSKEHGAQVVCFGHTHRAGADLIDDQLFINPGSIRQSRGVFEETYAVLSWDALPDIDVNFYTVDGKRHDYLSDRFSLPAEN